MKPKKLEKNVTINILTRVGLEPVTATLSNGVLFAHGSPKKRLSYSVSCVDAGDRLRGTLTRAQAERIVRGTAKSSLRKLPAFITALRAGGLGSGHTFKAFVRYAQRVEREPTHVTRRQPSAPCEHKRAVLASVDVRGDAKNHAVICVKCGGFRWAPVSASELTAWCIVKPKNACTFPEGATMTVLDAGPSDKMAELLLAKLATERVAPAKRAA